MEKTIKKDFYKEDRKLHYDTGDNNDKLIFNFRDINHTIRSLYEGRGSQKRILIILLEAESITQRKLTRQLGIQPGSASEILAKLEKGGLISRTENPDDRRTTVITLTERGRALAEEAKTQRKGRHEEMFSCLTEDEKGTLLTLLEKVNADWKERYKGSEDHFSERRHYGDGERRHRNEEGRPHSEEEGHHGERRRPHEDGRRND